MKRKTEKMIRNAVNTLAAVAFTFLMARTSVHSQQVVNIWSGAPPGTENWTQKEKVIENTPVGTVVLNVVTPTLTAYLPEKSKATGTGIIIAPGGYCVALAISNEGDAAALAAKQRHRCFRSEIPDYRKERGRRAEEY